MIHEKNFLKVKKYKKNIISLYINMSKYKNSRIVFVNMMVNTSLMEKLVMKIVEKCDSNEGLKKKNVFLCY